jgi:hypothetical protein
MDPQQQSQPSQNVPIQYLIAIFVVCIIALFFAQFFFFNKQSTTTSRASDLAGTKSLITPQSTSCTVSGQVLDMGSNSPSSCPTTNEGNIYKGVNFLTVRLVSSNFVTRTTVTNKNADKEDGYFSFPNVTLGTYEVCVDPPAGYQHYCNMPRVDDKSKIYGSQCAEIKTSVACSNVHLNIKK